MATVKEIINEGFIFHQDGKLEEAETRYNEALTNCGENAEICNLLGVLKLQQGDVNAAIEWIEKAVDIEKNEYFFESLFQAYIRAKAYDKIIEREKEVLKNFSKSFSLMFNLALAYKNLKNHKTAIIFYDKALKIDPTNFQAWFNLAHLYSIEGQCKNAISALKVCKKLKPNDNEIDYFLSIAYMRRKEYEKGLKLFETRLCKETAISLMEKTYPNLAAKNKLWKGENIKDKTLFVYYEAGFGDVIMFSRYLPLLKQRCKKLVFYPQKPLIPLIEENGLGVDEIIEGYIPEKNMDFDVHMPLLSAPYLLNLKGNKIFHTSEGYIAPNEKLTEEFKEKFFNNDKIKIGIKWQGNTSFDKDRVISIDAFYTLMDIPNTQFYSFQTFEGAEKTQELAQKFDLIDVGNELRDFGQTAAAIENVDLIICNDTSLAHLAGALGKPCFVLLPYEVNWRWHEDLRHCDWYDSIKLFRQETAGDWNGVFTQVRNCINKALEKVNQTL